MVEPESVKSPALAGGFSTTSATWEATHFKQWEKILRRINGKLSITSM